MPQIAEMQTNFGETVEVWWASSNGGNVRAQVSSDGWTAAAYDAFALATEPSSLQIYEDDSGKWWISYINSAGAIMRYYSERSGVSGSWELLL